LYAIYILIAWEGERKEKKVELLLEKDRICEHHIIKRRVNLGHHICLYSYKPWIS
jgi:hypothetical protein